MKLRSEQGSAVVEFAVVLPLLLMVVFGIIEFSLLLYNKAMLTNASREGARYGIILKEPRYSTPQITTEVNNYLSTYLISFNSGAPTVSTTRVLKNGVEADPSIAGLDSAEDYLTVEVSYVYEYLLIPRLITLFGGNFADNNTLIASTTMRAE